MVVVMFLFQLRLTMFYTFTVHVLFFLFLLYILPFQVSSVCSVVNSNRTHRILKPYNLQENTVYSTPVVFLTFSESWIPL